MSLIIVPSEKRLATMGDIDQALVRAQTLLQKKMPTDPDAHKERFRFFTQAAMKAPFLALDKSETDSQTWRNKSMTVKDTLNKVLPKVIMEAIEPKLGGIQAVMSGSAKIKDFPSFFWSHESGEKHVAQFCIHRIPNWGVSALEVYFVEIHAEFSSGAVFGISSTSNELKARFCFQQYSTNTAFLLQEMRTNPDQVRNEMDEWDRAAKSIC